MTTHIVSENATLRHALAYARRGWAVFPLAPRTKKPAGSLVPNGKLDATRDEGAIRHWFDGHPELGVGIALQPSGLILVDVDPRHAGDETLAELERANGELPPTVEAVTGGGGAHFLFQRPAGLEPHDYQPLWPGIDVKAIGYAVVAPSIHPDTGQVYRWALGSEPGRSEVAELPGWIAAAMAAHKNGHTAAPIPDRIPAGGRNAALASLGGTMRRRGMSQDAIEAALLAENAARCDPPLPESEVRDIAASISRYSPASPFPTGTGSEQDDVLPSPDGDALPASHPYGVGEAVEEKIPIATSGDNVTPLHFTDLGNAQRFIAEADGDALWNDVWSTWHFWDGSRFARDQALAVEKLAYRTTRRMYQDAYKLTDQDERERLAKWAIRSEGRGKVAAMLESAKHQLAVVPGDFDRDPDLYNVQNGTIDLQTRTPRPHAKLDMLTKRAEVSFDPAAACPFFLKFLDRIFEGNAAVIAYIRRIFGYSLTGRLSVHALFILYGTGRNGKSTLLYVIRRLGGDYAVHIKPEVFTEAKSDPQGFQLVDLAGARVVTAIETGAGRRLDEVLVKEMTGGDPITAAPKYGRQFTFYPVCKPFLATNHRPEIRGADEGIWSRPRLIPFNVRIPDDEQIPDDIMKAKLDAELSGILNWALDGLDEFRRIGLADPDIVRAATREYRDSSDVLVDWIEARCEVGAGRQAEVKALYADYKAFAGEDAITKKKFGMALEERNYKSGRKGDKNNARIRIGIDLRSDASDASTDSSRTHLPDSQEVSRETYMRTRIVENNENMSDASDPGESSEAIMAHARAALDTVYPRAPEDSR